MANGRVATLVGGWSERFRRHPLASAVVADLAGQADAIWRHAFELMRQESPEYRNAVDDEFTRESKGHCGELLKAIVAIASGRRAKASADPFEFVRTHAIWRARHHVPLVASLHAYRLAHRTYWTMTREALIRRSKQKETVRALAMLSDFWIELFDHVGAVLAEAHAVEEGLIVAQETPAYAGLIDDLLRGTPPRDAEAQRLCTLCGIMPPAPVALAVARPLPSGNGTQIDGEVTLRSTLRLIEQVLPSSVFGKLVGIHNGEAVAIVSGESVTARRVADALRRHLSPRSRNAPVAAIGVSLDASEIARLPQALEEARLALEFATAERPVHHFSDIDLPELLLRRADDIALRLIPPWASRLHPPETDQSRGLIRTIQAFAACNLNVKQTAQRLGVHTNTVYFRLNRIQKLAGLDPRSYSGVSKLLTVLRLLEIKAN
jgi:hypothetical protein